VKGWIVLIALAACHRAAPVSTRTVTDALGRSVQLGAVRRVVSLAPSSTEIVAALGAGDRLVGIDRFSDYPVSVHALPQVGTDMEPSLEKILALRPDVVLLATSANAQRSLEPMSRAGLSVYVSRADSLEGIYGDILGIGQVLERDAAAAALVARMKRDIAAMSARVADKAPTSCAVIVWPSPLIVAARGSHVGDLVLAAGGKNVVDDSPQPFPNYSTERLVKLAPQVLVIGSHANEAPTLDALERMDSIPAVRDRRMHLVDGDLLFRPGPRVVDGVAVLLKALHPELGDGGAR
jgi:iron complex transport system substrate-binding protein